MAESVEFESMNSLSEPAFWVREGKRVTENPETAAWTTAITKVEPNHLIVGGYPLWQLIEHSNLLEIAHLLIRHELPVAEEMQRHQETAAKAASLPAPEAGRFEGEDISQALGRCLLSDWELICVPQAGEDGPVHKTVFAMGRFCRYMACLLGNEAALDSADAGEPFSSLVYRAVTGEAQVDENVSLLIEAIATACVDHGVTPPSAQACRIAASVRADYVMSLCSGVGAITDIHGGAGRDAAEFFTEIVRRADSRSISLEEAAEEVIREYGERKKRIMGLGHRIHSRDPRRDVLWKRSRENGQAGKCLKASEIVGDVFTRVSGKRLPINVDGVIGAMVADMGFDFTLAKALFILGRAVGLSAHYFEEIATQRPMRRIDFGAAVYRGSPERDYPR